MQTLVERGCGLDVNFTGGFDELSLVASSGQMWQFFNGKSL